MRLRAAGDGPGWHRQESSRSQVTVCSSRSGNLAHPVPRLAAVAPGDRRVDLLVTAQDGGAAVARVVGPDHRAVEDAEQRVHQVAEQHVP
jgi:hypothetical protein